MEYMPLLFHSQAANRGDLLRDFRNNRITVAFTVDLFNEGMDFPNVQVIMFLRPTESKTVFLQQIGRGLRLTPGKGRLRVLDFIGNYKRANQIRAYLAKSRREVTDLNARGRVTRKFEYLYSTGCEVNFDSEVEEILSRQDTEDIGIGEIELTEAYYALAEQLGRKPNRSEIDKQGEYNSARYVTVFGSWIKFLHRIGDYTEASYHYPQGTHVGHVLSILWFYGQQDLSHSPFADEYVRMRGNLGQGRLATYRRQVKYKLQAAMELRLLKDDRREPLEDRYRPELTPLGWELRNVLVGRLKDLDLDFPRDENGIPSSRMMESPEWYNNVVLSAIRDDDDAATAIRRVVFRMHAIQQMLRFIYQVSQNNEVSRSFIYDNFFQSPLVLQFGEREGIEPATQEAARRRCPFLINLLAATGVIEQSRSSIKLLDIVLFPSLVKTPTDPSIDAAIQRLHDLRNAWPTRTDLISDDDISVLRELLGPTFLTDAYMFDSITILGEL